MPARAAAEHGDELRLREPGDLADGRDPSAMELLGGHGPDAPEPLDGKRVEKGELAVGRDDEQPVGLGDAARHLGEELRPRDADGDRQTDSLANVAPQPRRDLDGCAGDPLHAAHVEERLVDREPLDERTVVVEHREHRLARVGVRVHAGRDHDRLRAQPPGLPPAHRRADAVRLRLVAGREHDPAAHDDGAAAQARIVPLLDRREERVGVRVQDRRPGHGEHMFAYPALPEN